MKNKLLLTAGLLSLMIAAPISANAEMQVGDFAVSANAGIYSDYAFRGISQTDEDPSLQIGVDAAMDNGFYVGAWGSNVDFNDNGEGTLEVDLYTGFTNNITEELSYDVGAIYYAYPGADSSLDYDFWEISFGMGYNFGDVAASASVNYSPEYFGDTGDAFYYAVGADVPVMEDFTVSAHVGYQDIDDSESYTDWSVGVGYSYEGLDFSVAYVDTDLSTTDCAAGCDSRFIFGVSKDF